MAITPIDFYSSEALQFKFSNKIMFRELDEESVLLNLNDESYYALNATGTFLWKELVRNQSLANAFVSFKKHYSKLWVHKLFGRLARRPKYLLWLFAALGTLSALPGAQ